MATKAQQFDCLTGTIAVDGNSIKTPYAKFLVPGTSTTKTAWTDKDKSVAITSIALSNQGNSIYGDGIYDVEIYDGDPTAAPPNTGVLQYTVTNQKCIAVEGNARTVTSSSVTGSVDDSLVLCDTTSNSITYTLPDATTVGARIINVKKISAANTVTIAVQVGQTIDAVSTKTLSANNSTAQCISNGSNWYAIVEGSFVPLDGSTAMTGDLIAPNVDYVVTSLAALKALAIPTTTKTATNIYRSTAGDGGGGNWRWDSSDLSTEVTADTQSGVYAAPDSDNTGASGAWVRSYSVLTPAFFGAAGDGVADDTTELQAAINLSANRGEVLECLPGHQTFLVSSKVTLPSNSDIDFNSSTIKRDTSAGVFDMLENSDTSGGNTNIKIKNLIIDGDKDTDSRVSGNVADRFAGIRMETVTLSEFYNITVTGTVNAEIQAEGNRAGFFLESCSHIILERFIGYNNDKTAFLGYSSDYVTIKNAYVHDNDGSGLSSADSDFNDWSHIFAHDNSYSEVSLNGLDGSLSHVWAWNGATGFAGVNIGHDSAGNHSHRTIATDIHTFNNSGYGLTIVGSDNVKVSGLYSDGNTDRNVRIFSNSNASSIKNAVISNGTSNGILYSSGTGHILDDAEIYDNGVAGIYVDSGVGVTFKDGVKSYNNGQVTSANSAGILSASGNIIVRGGEYYDDQGTQTQEAGIWVSSGSIELSHTYLPTNKTYGLRQSSSPVFLSIVKLRQSTTDGMEGSFTASAGTSTVVNNGNARDANRISIKPRDSAAAALQGWVSSISAGVSFTVSFNSSAAGTEAFAYTIE